MWSDGSPDDSFCTALKQVFETVEAHTVTFPNPIRETDSSSTVYVAVHRACLMDAPSRADVSQSRD
jgi:hypothetical protein